MPDDKTYVPLSERLNQDVMHDNFVPKFSGLATVRPSVLVLSGVWLIFVPWLCSGLLVCAQVLGDAGSVGEAFIELVLAGISVLLCSTILFVQTRRFLRYREPD